MLSIVAVALPEWLPAQGWESVIRAIILLLIGIPLVQVAVSLLRRVLKDRVSAQGLLLLSKLVVYVGVSLVIIMTMRELGFKLTALLGAAGVAGIAIGFAAQTSLSNIISGFFLLWEKPFEIGDVVRIGEVTGVIKSVDLLSANVVTFDNQSVRIPNETLVKTQFTNITRFPIRRLDINIGVAYKQEAEHVLRVLREIIDANPHALDEPEPVVAFTGFGESQLNFFVGAWFVKADFQTLRNSLLSDIQKRFAKEAIEIPYPHRVVILNNLPNSIPPATEGTNSAK